MANEFAASFGPNEGYSESTGSPQGGIGSLSFVPVGTVGISGAGFNRKQVGTFLCLFRLPNAAALVTGLTFGLSICDDTGNPPSAGGLKSYWGVTIAPITSGTSVPDETIFAGATETFAQITHGAAIGAVVYADIAAVVANMGGLAAGNLALARVRRVGNNILDTHTGRVVLLRTEIRNT